MFHSQPSAACTGCVGKLSDSEWLLSRTVAPKSTQIKTTSFRSKEELVYKIKEVG